MTRLIVSPNRMARGIDDFFNDFFSFPTFRTNGETDFVPRVNIAENDERVLMEFEVPGMEKKDIKVKVKDNVLMVCGERSSKSEEKNRSYVRTEIRAGSFCRSFTLPDTVDADKIKADYKNGILELTLAKREEAKPKEIEVNIS